MGYLLLMTFAGSALFIGYLCWKKILGKSMTQCMRYRALMLVMLVYVIPWAWFKGMYRWAIGLFWLGEVDARAKGLIDIANIETKEIAYQTKEYHVLMLVVLIWFAIAMLFLLIRIIISLRKSHALHALAIKCEDKNLEQTMKYLQETIRYRHRPEIVWTRVDNETFTLGTIVPVIFLQKEYAQGDLYWILKHEMTHIIRMDLWVKLLLEFVCCLHWFNPLIYLLEHEIRYLCETSCDERVVKGCTEEECRAYTDLLDRNRSDDKPRNLFDSASEDGNEIDKRIALLKNRKCIRAREKAVTICIFVLLVFLSSLTALAYPKVHHVKSETISVAEDSVDGNNFWIYDYAEDGYGTFTDIVLYDEQFVGEDGQIYPVDFGIEQDVCSDHNIVSGVVQIHQKDDSNGCTIETYEGTRCVECNTMWKGDLLRRARKVPCPH